MYNQNQQYGNQQNMYGNQPQQQNMYGNQQQGGNQQQQNMYGNQQMGQQQMGGNQQQNMYGNQPQSQGNWNFMKQQSQQPQTQAQYGQNQMVQNQYQQQPQIQSQPQMQNQYQQQPQMQSQQPQGNWNFMKQQSNQQNQNQYQQPQMQGQQTNQYGNQMNQQNQQYGNQMGGQMQNQQQMGGQMQNQQQMSGQMQNQQMGGQQMGGQMNNQQMGGQQNQYGSQFGGMPPQQQQLMAPNQPPQSFQGQLRVTVIGCSSIKAADSNGKSDPYVVVTINAPNRPSGSKNSLKGGQKTKTKKRTLDPVYNESFNLNVQDARNQYVFFDVFDWDRFSKNDHLGWASCPLSNLSNGFGLKFDLAILDGKGSVSVTLQASNFGYPQQFHQWCKEQTQQMLSPKTCGTVSVTIVGCRGLMAADMNGKSDPYLVLKVKGKVKQGGQMVMDGKPVKKKKKKKYLNKTKTQKSTLNPVYSETFKLKVENSEQEYLQIDIYDWDRFTKDDSLGFCVFPLRNVVRATPMKFDTPGLPVQDGTGNCSVIIEAMDFGFPKSKWDYCMQQSMNAMNALNNQVLMKKKQKGKNNKKVKSTVSKTARIATVMSLGLGAASLLMK